MATYTGQILINVIEQNNELNTSKVNYLFRVVTSGASTWGNAATNATISYLEGNEIKSETVSVKTYNFASNSVLEIASKEVVVEHNEDGSCQVEASFTWNHGNNVINNTTNGPVRASNRVTLPSIPRESTFVSIQGNLLGEEVVVSIKRYLESYHHQLGYRFVGQNEWTFLEERFEETLSFVPSLDLAYFIPNHDNGKIEFCLKTFSGNIQIGKDQFTSHMLYVPENVLPSVQGLVYQDKNIICQELGLVVKNQSDLTIEAQASGMYGSTIESYRFQINDRHFTSKEPFYSLGIPMSSEAYSVSLTVIDSRRHSYTRDFIDLFTVLDYSHPSLSYLNIERCDQEGNENEEGDYALISFKTSITPLENKNQKMVNISYRKRGQSVWNDLVKEELSDYETNYRKVLSLENGFSQDEAYEIYVTLEDSFGPHSGNIILLSPTHISESFLNGGRGIAFGKNATLRDTLEIEYDLKINNRVLDKSGKEIPLGLSFPIGTIWITVTNDNPANTFGGSWQRFGQGKTLFGVDESDSDFSRVEKTGGMKSFNNEHAHSTKGHVLTIEEMPSHNHGGVSGENGSHSHTGKIKATDGHLSGSVNEVRKYSDNSSNISVETITDTVADHSHTLANQGDNASHHHGDTDSAQATQSILNPYITVYFWVKVA